MNLLRELLESINSDKLEKLIVRAFSGLKSSVSESGQKNLRKISEALINASDDYDKFSKVWDDSLAKHPDSMDLLADEIYALAKVKTVDELFDMYFPDRQD